MNSATLQTPISQRYLALDVLRGLTIAFMIIVNSPGSWEVMYSPLAHASWHGFTPTDLVFPTFLFVVGNAMSFAMKRLAEMPSKEFYRKVFKRAFLIFAIGWLLNAFPFFDYSESGDLVFINLLEVRLFGVLQRIAVCYLLAALILYWGGIRLGWIFSIVALVAYWPIMYFFGESGDPYSLTGNAAIKLDLALIGAERMYTGEGIAFDPEGLLSSLTATVNVILGFIVGKMIQIKGNTLDTIKRLIGFGIVLMTLAYVWDLAFPINKKIWTSPYVLLTVSWDLFLLAGLIWSIEIRNWKGWTYFFEVFGRNPLILYVASGIVISIFSIISIGDQNLKNLIYTAAFTSWLSPKMASFLFSVSYMLLIWAIGYWMNRRKIYIKV